MMKNKISIIGGGNLGKSIALGLIKSKKYKPSEVIVTRRNLDKIKDLSEKGIEITDDNAYAVLSADIVVFCLKPYKIKQVLEKLKPELLEGKPMIVSTVTGFTLQNMTDVLGSSLDLFRAMPNTAISVGESMTCISTNSNNKDNIEFINSIFKAMGDSVIIEDEHMAAATVLAASGIAFAMRYIRAAMQAGIEIGFSSDLSKQIVNQTVKGASVLLQQNNLHPEFEIDKVTTPKGITISGLSKMELHGFSASVTQGVLASYGKIKDVKE